jgi:hypothetical protein
MHVQGPLRQRAQFQLRAMTSPPPGPRTRSRVAAGDERSEPALDGDRSARGKVVHGAPPQGLSSLRRR